MAPFAGDSIGLRPELQVTVEIDQALRAGRTPTGEVVVVPFDTGTVTMSDGATGRVLPGGTDWQIVRPDGALEIRAHYLLETEHGEVIEVRSEGLAAPAGDAGYYFRTHIRMATAAERLEHFNRLLFVGVGRRVSGGVEISVYAVP